MPGPSRTRFALLFGLLTAPVLAADSGPPAAKKVTLREGNLTPAAAARAIRTATAIDVDVSALDVNKAFALDLLNADFWTAVGQLAARTDSRVVTTGGRVALKPGRSQAACPPSSAPSCSAEPWWSSPGSCGRFPLRCSVFRWG